MSHSNQMIATPISIVGDIATLLGRNSGDLGDLIVNGNIKAGSKYKPFRNVNVGMTVAETHTACEVANYGLTIPDCNTATLYDSNGAKDWSYIRPTGQPYSWFRAFDFAGYYHGAPEAPVFCTWQGTDIVKNILNTNSVSVIPFFVYQKTGMLADKAPDTTEGTSVASVGRSSAQIAACLDLSDVNASGGAKITALTNPYLGIAIYQGTTFKQFVPCRSKLIAEQTTRDIDMYQLRTEDITGLQGEFTAVTCIRYGTLNNYKYIPLPKIPFGSGSAYRNTFNLKLGGAEDYTYAQRGVSATSSPSSTNVLYTTETGAYVTIRVQNNSGIVHDSSLANADGWLLYVDISGSASDGNQTWPISRTTSGLSIRNYYPGTTTFLHIANGGTEDLVFFVPNIWSNSGSGAAPFVRTGSVSLSCALKYVTGGVTSNFTPASQQAFLSVNYGNS